jgi:drug/metabolite transporter (DMT)-like permease
MKNTRTKAMFSLIFVCLVWGSSFLFVKIAATQFGPFRLAVYRQIPAAIILFIYGFFVQKQNIPSKKHFFNQFSIGVLTIGCWNGLANWAILTLPISLLSLVASLVPIAIALLNYFLEKDNSLSKKQWFGILLGFGGLGIVFGDGWRDLMRPDYFYGIVCVLLAVVLWAFGTVFAKRISTENSSPVMDSGIQLLAGGVFMFVVSQFYDWHKPLIINPLGWVSLIYVSLFGSVLAMTAYLFALKNLPATIAYIRMSIQ